MPAAEDVERQIAVAVVVAVEKAAFLMAVQRIVGRIEIEHDRLGGFAVRIEKRVDQRPLDQGRRVRDPTIAVDHGRAELQPVQRALARQGRTPAVPRLQSTEHHAHDRIVPQRAQTVWKPNVDSLAGAAMIFWVMAHISGGERSQLLLLPESVDDYVGSDNVVRFIEAFVDGLDLHAAGFRRVQPKATGRPGYDPADLLKL